MGSLNKSHHEGTGGVVIFNGELILLYCDAVQFEVERRGSVKGRLYLTTHRLVFTATPINQNANLKSFTAPFFAMYDLDLGQPVFGANYIKGKVRGEDGSSMSFKMKFNKGGAIELGQAMANAARQAEQNARSTNYQAPPPYTPSATEALYQASNVYQPQYPIGFAMPTQLFNEAPPAGFIYATNAPPPYPGLVTTASMNQPQHGYGQPQQQFNGYSQPGMAGFAPANGFGAPQAGFANAPPAYGQQFEQPPPYAASGDSKKQQ